SDGGCRAIGIARTIGGSVIVPFPAPGDSAARSVAIAGGGINTQESGAMDVALRDYFAGQVMIGAWDNDQPLPGWVHGDSPERVAELLRENDAEIASHCWRIADAMLAARTPTPAPLPTDLRG